MVLALAAEIARPYLSFAEHVAQRLHDAISNRPLVDVPQHENGRPEQRHRVRQALTCDIRRAAVDRLEHPDLAAQVGCGHDAQSADEAGTEIRHDVAV